MENPCIGCGGKCCIGIIDVYPTDEVYTDSTLTREYKTENYDRVMRTVNQRCVALTPEGLCSIYDKRPAICRAFQFGSRCCNNLRDGHLNSHSCDFCIVSDAFRKAKHE